MAVKQCRERGSVKEFPAITARMSKADKKRLEDTAWKLRTSQQALIEKFIVEGLDKAEGEINGIDIC